jgi:hypothetical protein
MKYDEAVEVLEEEKTRIKNINPVVMKSYYENRVKCLQSAIEVLKKEGEKE